MKSAEPDERQRMLATVTALAPTRHGTGVLGRVKVPRAPRAAASTPAATLTPFAWLDPAAVVRLSLIMVGIAMVIEQGFSRGRDADDVGHGAFGEVRHRTFFDQALLLERAHVLSKPRMARVVFQIVGERDSVPPGALEQIHLGAAQVIDAAVVSDLLALAAFRQREVVFATLAEIVP